MRIKKNKRGLLLAEETLKIVLAVIAIVFLIYFLTSLYFSRVNSDKLKQAESLLKDSQQSIKVLIANINDGETQQFHLQSPGGWYLLSFRETGGPNSCAGESCLCICNKNYGFNFWESQAEECDESGVCLAVDGLRQFEPMEIKEQFISINKESNFITIT